MSTSLVEAAKYTVNMVKKGVLMEIVKDSVVMQKLTWIDVVGNAYQYLRETTLPTAEFYDPGEIWTESTGDVTQKTAVIKILGGDADMDNFVKKTRSNYTDLQAETIQAKAKAVKHTFLAKFYYGDSAASAKEFDGVHVMLNSADFVNQKINMNGALSAAKVDELIDLVRDGKPDVLITTRTNRRRIMQYLRTLNNIEMTRDEFGNPVRMWNGVPIEYDDFLLDTETASTTSVTSGTGSTTCSMLALTFGTDSLVGLQNGGLETIPIGQVDNKDAKRYRIRWYVSLAMLRTIRQARINNISTGAMVA